jgi:hypothetical protein
MQFRLIDYNFAQLQATALTASSADPSFPVSNVKNPIRSRVHRTAGNFVIGATNNKINFKKSGGGSELTATISSGTYLPATLAAAIKTALETADGVNTYTVTYSTLTGKWTIATSGAFLSILWLTGTNTAVSIGSSIGFDVTSDATGAVTYTGANIAIHTEESIVLDLQTTEAIDSFALLFDLIGGNKFSSSAVLTLQANASNSWAAPAVSQVLSIDAVYGIATYFFASDQTYRYWRLKIVDPKNANLYVETSKIVLGKGIQLAHLPARGFQDKLTDASDVKETKYGHRYSDLYPMRRTLSFNYPGLSDTDAATLQLAFRRNGSSTPVAIALDPLAGDYDKDRFFIYGFFGSAQQITQASGKYFSVPVALTEAV